MVGLILAAFITRKSNGYLIMSFNQFNAMRRVNGVYVAALCAAAVRVPMPVVLAWLRSN